jgi:hypothetical protein
MVLLDNFRADNAAQLTQDRWLCRYLVPSVVPVRPHGLFFSAARQQHRIGPQPERATEVNRQQATEHENPFYCLPDDSLRSEIKVTTDQLLLLPIKVDISPNVVLLEIRVRMQPRMQSRFRWRYQ